MNTEEIDPEKSLDVILEAISEHSEIDSNKNENSSLFQNDCIFPEPSKDENKIARSNSISIVGRSNFSLFKKPNVQSTFFNRIRNHSVVEN